MTVEVAEWTGPDAAWDEYVQAAPQGTVCHLAGWRKVIEGAYRHRTFFLSAGTGREIRGLLPLVLIRSRLFGNNLVSMPFVDYGGPVTTEGPEVRTRLTEEALRLARCHGATLSLRCATDQGLELPVWLEKLTMHIDLGNSVDDLWRRLPAERRNRIRKGQRNNLVTSFHGAEALDEFYAVFATNMRDLGSPVHSRDFFRKMFAALAPHLRITLVRHRDRAIGAACCLYYKDVVTIPGWISSLRASFSLCPNQVLHWELMRFGIEHGYRLLDLGRSSRGSGTFEAKRQWHASARQLYWYYSPRLPPRGGGQGRYSRHTALWQKLPLPLANLLGPRLRQKLPN